MAGDTAESGIGTPTGINRGVGCMTRFSGKVIFTSVPLRRRLLRSNLPPCRSTSPFTIGKPRPLPP